MPRREIFLLTVKGERARPGLTAALTETMGKHNVTVLDIGQAEIHDMLSALLKRSTVEKHARKFAGRPQQSEAAPRSQTTTK